MTTRDRSRADATAAHVFTMPVVREVAVDARASTPSPARGGPSHLPGTGPTPTGGDELLSSVAFAERALWEAEWARTPTVATRPRGAVPAALPWRRQARRDA